MDGFSIIQNFFTRMRCNACSSYLDPDGIQLLQENRGLYVINVKCTQCSHQMGMMMVGVGGVEVVHSTSRKKFKDPELTPQELKRLSVFDPIDYDDVVDAHRFFTNLEADWQKHLPEEMRQLEITLELESEED